MSTTTMQRLQAVALLITVLATVAGWVFVSGGERQSVIGAVDRHEQMLARFEAEQRQLLVEMAAIKQDVKWIRRVLEQRSRQDPGAP
jgi:Tfp pilus assembly protein PilO